MSLVKRMAVDRATTCWTAFSIVIRQSLARVGCPIEHVICVLNHGLWHVGPTTHHGCWRSIATAWAINLHILRQVPIYRLVCLRSSVTIWRLLLLTLDKALGYGALEIHLLLLLVVLRSTSLMGCSRIVTNDRLLTQSDHIFEVICLCWVLLVLAVYCKACGIYHQRSRLATHLALSEIHLLALFDTLRLEVDHVTRSEVHVLHVSTLIAEVVSRRDL